MPTYEYECTGCKYEFEAFQKMSEEPLKECPRCRGPIRRKISGGSGLLFKGKGFYITDYRSENYKKKASEEKPKTETKEKSETPKPSPKPTADKPTNDKA
jgi:putative FmdB family regulatory protein